MISVPFADILVLRIAFCRTWLEYQISRLHCREWIETIIASMKKLRKYPPDLLIDQSKLMNIHEYQAKQLFHIYEIPVPDGKPAMTSESAEQAARELGGDGWVVKAQVHAGGRGKVGGVKLAKKVTEVVQFSRDLLGKRLVTIQTDSAGLPINSLLIEKTYPIKRELYLSALVDRASERIIFIASAAGGMDIETVAHETPEQIISVKFIRQRVCKPINAEKWLTPWVLKANNTNRYKKSCRACMTCF